MKKIYFAGAWFSPVQSEQHTRVFNALNETNKFSIFNPRTETLIDKDSSEDKMTQSLIGNIKGVLEADVIVALADWPYDPGTIWETGLAYGKTPIIYFAENLGERAFNLMLAKTGRFAGNVEDLLKLLDDEESYVIRSVYDFDGEIE